VADKLLSVATRGTGGVPEYVSKKLKDMGDGSYAEIVYLSPDPGVSIGTVELEAGEAHVGEVGGRTVMVSVEKTRPADTTAYTANDAVAATGAGNSWEFTVGRVATGSGLIVGAQFATDDANWVSRMELDLYDSDIATPLADNAEATRLYVNQAKFLGTIAFPAAAKKTTNSTAAEAVASMDRALGYKCAAASKIYGVLRTLDGDATPESGKKYRINLTVVQD
jgi:hypothetical protein